MKTYTLKPARLLVAALALIGLSASAQIITTFETISDYTGSTISFANNRALTQTFSNVLQVQSMTYRFVRTSGAATAADTLNYYFVEWDTNTNRATTLIQSGALSVPGIGSFTSYNYPDPDTNDPIPYMGYDYLFNLNFTTGVASKTYAMILVGTSGSSDLSMQLIDTNDNFQWGSAYRTDLTNGYTFSTMQSTSGSGYAPAGTDWGFAQIVVELGPVPEPATAAAGIGAVLIAGLVGFRTLQRRRALATAPVSA